MVFGNVIVPLWKPSWQVSQSVIKLFGAFPPVLRDSIWWTFKTLSFDFPLQHWHWWPVWDSIEICNSWCPNPCYGWWSRRRSFSSSWIKDRSWNQKLGCCVNATISWSCRNCTWVMVRVSTHGIGVDSVGIDIFYHTNCKYVIAWRYKCDCSKLLNKFRK